MATTIFNVSQPAKAFLKRKRLLCTVKIQTKIRKHHVLLRMKQVEARNIKKNGEHSVLYGKKRVEVKNQKNFSSTLSSLERREFKQSTCFSSVWAAGGRVACVCGLCVRVGVWPVCACGSRGNVRHGWNHVKTN